MLSHVDIHSSVAVYIQIENQVRFAIASGKLKATDKLPSVQELSKRLGINQNTVAKAYRDLEVMGLVYTRRGMGVFIQKGVQAKCREDVRRHILTRLHEAISEAKAAGLNKKDVVDAVEKSMAADVDPYGEVPASVLALVKRPRKRGPKPPRRRG